MVLSVFPVTSSVAEAATTGLTLDQAAAETLVGVQVNFVASTINDGESTDGTVITLADGSNGGSFYTGTTGGACNSVTPDADNEFAITNNKGVCYSNSTAGVYTIDVALLDGTGGSEIASESIAVTVTEEVAEEKKVDICHWSEGDSEFSLLNVSVSSLGNAHGASGSNDGDIIPVVDGYAGQNLDTDYNGATGAEVLAAGCVVPDPVVDMCPNIEGGQETVPEGYVVEEGSCIEETETSDEVVYGCTDEEALNYNPDATELGQFVCEYPDPEPCEAEQNVYVDVAVDNMQGPAKGDGSVAAGRSNPDDATGDSDWSSGGSTGFYSLGLGGWIEVSFDKYVVNVDGDDISVHEATNGTYPLETAMVEVSQDSSTWYELTEEARNDNDEGGDNVTLLDFDETGLSWIKYVRLTDTTDESLHTNGADGFDLDTVDATYVVCDDPEPEPEPEGAVISGQKFEDYNQNGEWTEGEPYLEGVEICLYDLTEEEEVVCVETNELGYYVFSDLDESSSYEVTETVVAPWEQTAPEAGSCTFEAVEDETEYFCDFGNYNPEPETTRVSGYVHEQGSDYVAFLSGWTVYAFNGTETFSTTTDEFGMYYFDLADGDWEISEEVQVDWTQVKAVQDSVDIFPSEGDAVCNFVVPEDESDYECDFYNEYVSTDDEDGGGDDEEEEEETSSGSSSSGGSSGTRLRRPEPTPIVAGVTDSVNQCEFLLEHMQMGVENNPFEVQKLQLFLNIFMDANLPVTGYFGPMTDQSVKNFQLQYRSEILDPWYERGIVSHNNPTGYVYKTTKWKINDIVCPGWDPYPSFDGEDLTRNIDL
jgi:peptidoglycan hydrolase-like protein with peptidoglycan-binding domain